MDDALEGNEDELLTGPRTGEHGFLSGKCPTDREAAHRTA